MEIAGHLWLLEKIQATRRFLTFGNQTEVPRLWLRKHGKIPTPVEFYFVSDAGDLAKIR